MHRAATENARFLQIPENRAVRPSPLAGRKTTIPASSRPFCARHEMVQTPSAATPP